MVTEAPPRRDPYVVCRACHRGRFRMRPTGPGTFILICLSCATEAGPLMTRAPLMISRPSPRPLSSG